MTQLWTPEYKYPDGARARDWLRRDRRIRDPRVDSIVERQAAFSLIVKGVVQSSNSNGFTTPTFDSTLAVLVVVMLSKLNGTSPTISDNKSFTWTPLTQVTNGPDGQLFYGTGTGGSGHTLTVSGTSNFSSIVYYAFSGGHASPFNKESGAFTPSATSLQPGSLTPDQDNSLFVIGAAHSGSSASYTINSGFTTPDQAATIGGTAYGVAASYLIQGTAAAVNPTWSWTPSQGTAAPMAVFKPAAGATNLDVLIGEPVTGSSVLN